MSAKNSKDALLQAADLIESRGLAKHHLEDELGGLCAFGAINLASRGNARGRGNKVGIAAARRLARNLKMSLSDVVWWNNALERTPADVIAALRNAAHSPSGTTPRLETVASPRATLRHIASE